MTRQQVFILAGLGSALLLAGAFVFQAFGYAPCTMCLWQRWPHAAAVLIAALGYFLPSIWIALAGAAATLTTAGIGGYHTGVERGWWDGPATCTSGSVDGISADDLLNQIMAAPLVRCDEIAWELLGVSMASWNMILSLGLTAIWLIAAKRRS